MLCRESTYSISKQIMQLIIILVKESTIARRILVIVGKVLVREFERAILQ
jgi:hypothetical protein